MPINNQFVPKDGPLRVVRLPLVALERKARWLKAARARKMNLVDFMLAAADLAADKEGV